ncbi:MAG: precorrin-2 C(20)-methyltransferase [Synergistaceae bacterium]|nr:precorrin-2 C(20)-methyltransferase [Synergistaceae bacterium]
MTNFTHLIIAGVGPGDSELITLKAIREAETSDMILVPRSRINERGLAEKVIAHHLPRKLTPILFPMIRDSKRRDEIIFSQLEAIRPEIESSEKIFFPVIGDSVLYSTGAYLIEAMKKITAVDVGFIPGISAHSLACSCAKKFLALSDEILSVIPGTASPEKISSALEVSDSIAVYKPSAIRDIKSLIDPQKFRMILRVDFAGIEGKEKIVDGESALEGIGEYLSVVLLKK